MLKRSYLNNEPFANKDILNLEIAVDNRRLSGMEVFHSSYHAVGKEQLEWPGDL